MVIGNGCHTKVAGPGTVSRNGAANPVRGLQEPIGPVDRSADPMRGNLRTADLAVLAIGTFTLGVDGFVLSGLLPQVAPDLRVSVGTAGQLTTLFAVVYAVGSPVIAAVIGNWDRRVLLAGGMAVFIVGMVLQAAGPDFATVAAGRVVAALGAAAYQANAYSTAGLLSDDAQWARSLAVVAGGSSLALVAGLPFGILAGQIWGWRAALWILVALSAISSIAVALLPAVHAPGSACVTGYGHSRTGGCAASCWVPSRLDTGLPARCVSTYGPARLRRPRGDRDAGLRLRAGPGHRGRATADPLAQCPFRGPARCCRGDLVRRSAGRDAYE